MLKKIAFICVFSCVWAGSAIAQQTPKVEIQSLKENSDLMPGQIFNLTFFITNKTNGEMELNANLAAPEDWKIINQSQNIHLVSGEKQLMIYTIQVPSDYPVGQQNVRLAITDSEKSDTLNTAQTQLYVSEIEKLSLLLVESPDYVLAGERFTATLLLQNLGNTTKKVYLDTYNCDVEGGAELEVEPGASETFSIYNQTSEDLAGSQTVYISVRATVSGETRESISHSFTIFPTQENRRDLFFRYPVTASATYLTSNKQDKIESAWQIEIQGRGTLDTEGNHTLEFLARAPDNNNLSFLGLYDQYYISYANENMELFVGERSFSFTPLTESSRFGLGTENKIILNNGLSFGFLYVKPRFYDDIENEMAGYVGFKITEDNKINAHLISKKVTTAEEPIRLASITAELDPVENMHLDVEFSRGYFMNEADNAIRGTINTQFSIFNLAGTYYYTGKKYPGYYTNSNFYSGNLSANLTENLSIGAYAKEDFRNAALDTFFVTAPYSRSFQSYINYKIASRAYLKLYWRDYERKDRLALDKFHYKTSSTNLRFNHKFRKINYDLLGQYGKTTNLLAKGENSQSTYLASANATYRFNSAHSLRVFGSWSNVNSFVTGDQRNLTAGLSLMSNIGQNFNAELYLQNAYNIDDYFRNRNLMQLNLDYTFLNNHKISLRSFYTLFRQQVDNPEFTLSLNYTYNLGIPLKQVIKAGDITGRITYENGEPAVGVVLSLRDKQTITDENGAFWFKTLQPGQHLLFVDKEHFKIDEVTNIPTPIEIEVVQDRESVINFRITSGAKLTGTLDVNASEISVLNADNVDLSNIILELKNEFEFYRLTSDVNGNFSFPIVRPGEWTLRIYTNSIPAGYEIKQSVYNLPFKPGENTNLVITLDSKKRNIIFKSADNTLTPMTPGNTESMNVNSVKQKIEEPDTTEQEEFYSIQVGAFQSEVSADSRFFQEEQFDFVKQIDNFHKYFIGRFSTVAEAKKEWERLYEIFRNPFIVKVKNDEIIPLWENK